MSFNKQNMQFFLPSLINNHKFQQLFYHQNKLIVYDSSTSNKIHLLSPKAITMQQRPKTSVSISNKLTNNLINERSKASVQKYILTHKKINQQRQKTQNNYLPRSKYNRNHFNKKTQSSKIQTVFTQQQSLIKDDNLIKEESSKIKKANLLNYSINKSSNMSRKNSVIIQPEDKLLKSIVQKSQMSERKSIKPSIKSIKSVDRIETINEKNGNYIVQNGPNKLSVSRQKVSQNYKMKNAYPLRKSISINMKDVNKVSRTNLSTFSTQIIRKKESEDNQIQINDQRVQQIIKSQKMIQQQNEVMMRLFDPIYGLYSDKDLYKRSSKFEQLQDLQLNKGVGMLPWGCYEIDQLGKRKSYVDNEIGRLNRRINEQLNIIKCRQDQIYKLRIDNNDQQLKISSVNRQQQGEIDYELIPSRRIQDIKILTTLQDQIVRQKKNRLSQIKQQQLMQVKINKNSKQTNEYKQNNNQYKQNNDQQEQRQISNKQRVLTQQIQELTNKYMMQKSQLCLFTNSNISQINSNNNNNSINNNSINNNNCINNNINKQNNNGNINNNHSFNNTLSTNSKSIINSKLSTLNHYISTNPIHYLLINPNNLKRAHIINCLNHQYYSNITSLYYLIINQQYNAYLNKNITNPTQSTINNYQTLKYIKQFNNNKNPLLQSSILQTNNNQQLIFIDKQFIHHNITITTSKTQIHWLYFKPCPQSSIFPSQIKLPQHYIATQQNQYIQSSNQINSCIPLISLLNCILSLNPQLIFRLIQPVYNNVFSCWLNINNSFQPVYVDGYLPYTGKLNSWGGWSEQYLWVGILLKCSAKLFGGYDQIIKLGFQDWCSVILGKRLLIINKPSYQQVEQWGQKQVEVKFVQYLQKMQKKYKSHIIVRNKESQQIYQIYEIRDDSIRLYRLSMYNKKIQMSLDEFLSEQSYELILFNSVDNKSNEYKKRNNNGMNNNRGYNYITSQYDSYYKGNIITYQMRINQNKQSITIINKLLTSQQQNKQNNQKNYNIQLNKQQKQNNNNNNVNNMNNINNMNNRRILIYEIPNNNNKHEKNNNKNQQMILKYTFDNYNNKNKINRDSSKKDNQKDQSNKNNNENNKNIRVNKMSYKNDKGQQILQMDILDIKKGQYKIFIQSGNIKLSNYLNNNNSNDQISNNRNYKQSNNKVLNNNNMQQKQYKRLKQQQNNNNNNKNNNSKINKINNKVYNNITNKVYNKIAKNILTIISNNQSTMLNGGKSLIINKKTQLNQIIQDQYFTYQFNHQKINNNNCIQNKQLKNKNQIKQVKNNIVNLNNIHKHNNKDQHMKNNIEPFYIKNKHNKKYFKSDNDDYQ